MTWSRCFQTSLILHPQLKLDGVIHWWENPGYPMDWRIKIGSWWWRGCLPKLSSNPRFFPQKGFFFCLINLSWDFMQTRAKCFFCITGARDNIWPYFFASSLELWSRNNGNELPKSLWGKCDGTQISLIPIKKGPYHNDHFLVSAA